MECDICGSSRAWRKARIEGALVTACDKCMSHGEEIIEEQPKSDFFEVREIHPNFASRVRLAREGRRLTVLDLSRILGEKEGTLSKIEKGDVIPSADVAARLERELGIEILCSPSEFRIKTKPVGKLTVGDVAEIA